MNKTKLIKLRNNIQSYLDFVEREDKVKNLDTLINSNTNIQIASLIEKIEEKFEDIPMPEIDNSEVVEAIKDMTSRLNPSDNKDVIQAISEIRFPEVNFPNKISVDNFPPQK